MRVLGIEHDLFESRLEMAREENFFTSLEQMQTVHWRAHVTECKAIVVQERGRPFPQDVGEQLCGAISSIRASVRGWRSHILPICDLRVITDYLPTHSGTRRGTVDVRRSN